MNDPQPHGALQADAGLHTSPSYAGRTRYTQLEYEALLANASLGIAFTRDRRFFLCNPKFAQMFGWGPDELIGQPGDVVYPSADSYAALGRIAVPILSSGQQMDVEWEVRRKDGSTFFCRMIAKAIDANHTGHGTVWICEDITEKRRRAEQVERLLAEQAAILGTASVGIVFIRDRRIVRCNLRYEQMYGYAPGELDGQPTSLLYADAGDHERGSEIYERFLDAQPSRRTELRRRKDGTTFWARIAGRAVDPRDPEKGSVWTVEDVTEELRIQEALQRVLAEQELVLDNATVGIAFVRARAIQRCNRFLEEMVGAAQGELLGQSSAVLFAHREDWERAGRLAYENTAPGGKHDAECRFRRKDGSTFLCRTRGRRIDKGEAEQEWIWSFEDVTAEREAEARVRAARDALEQAVAERTAELRAANERLEAEIGDRKQAEERARHLADHDALTGLPNRRLLEDRLTQALALSFRNRQHTAVMFIDLDRFKTINDSLGHAVGDALLKEVAERLARQLREGDTICRIGGDEFVVVLPEVKRSSDVALVAQKVIEQLSQPMRIEASELAVTPSIGIAVFPDDGRDAETLIRNADAAMYHAKESGRGNCQFFTEKMNLAASRRLTLENDLRRALANEELAVHYQPIVDAKTGRVCGHEALVRWVHPARGVVAPGEFIQAAEDTGLILKIGEWMLRQACRWASSLAAHRGLTVAVNLSARQFQDPKLVELIARVLAETGLPAELLQLEITEGTAMQRTDVALATLNRLKKLGVSVAIDDFGTGYSSFSYLRRFPVDTLKIDRSFVADIDGDGEQRAIVAAIVSLAQVLGLTVTAEGVETETQREFLRRAGCDRIQGYLVGRPLDGEAAARALT